MQKCGAHSIMLSLWPAERFFGCKPGRPCVSHVRVVVIVVIMEDPAPFIPDAPSSFRVDPHDPHPHDLIT